MPGLLRVLVFGDSSADAERWTEELRRGRYLSVAERVTTAAALEAALERDGWDVVLLQESPAGLPPGKAVQTVRDRRPELPIVVVSASAGPGGAADAIRGGASDFLRADDLARLPAVVERELRRDETRRYRRGTDPTHDRAAAIVASCRDAVIAVTAEGLIAGWNPAAERIYGWSAREVVGKPVSVALPPERGSETAGAFAEVRRGRSVEAFDAVRVRKDGRTMDVSVSLFPLLAEDGSQTGAASIVRDVTDRKRAEDRVRASEARFKALIEKGSDAVLLVDAVGSILYASPAVERMVGAPAEDCLGRSLFGFEHPEDEAGHRAGFREFVRQGGGHFAAPARFRRADGAYRWVETTFTDLLRDPDVGAVAVNVRDATDGREADAARDRLLAQLRLQFDRLPVGYLVSGPDFRYTRWNPAAERLFGYTEAEALGRHPFELIVPPQSRPQVSAVFDRLAAGDMDAHGTCENVAGDGRTVACEWHNTPLFAPDGTFEGIMSLARDVTDRRRLEEQFRQAQKMDAVGRLAGGIAHDFNNLLTIINGYSDLLLHRVAVDDPSWEMVDEIHKAGLRSAGLTRQLLAFSRQQLLAPRLLDLNTVVAESEKMFRRLIGEDIRLALALAPDLGSVRADPGQVEQVILNLVLNARDAMPAGGTLAIETRNAVPGEAEAHERAGARPGPCVVFTVRDTGSGMTAEVKSRIFEPFFTTKEMGKGTGLGLAVVHGIVQQSGGHIDVDTSPGVGTEFRIFLPREGQAAHRDEPSVEPRVAPRGAETILLVEDEDAVRALGHHILKGCGYTVLEAIDAEDALRVAARFARKVNLLVTDVVMPGKGGRQLAEELRNWHRGLRVLFVSGYTDDSVVRHGIEEREVNFLQKPFTPLQLAQKVRESLDGSQVGPERQTPPDHPDVN